MRRSGNLIFNSIRNSPDVSIPDINRPDDSFLRQQISWAETSVETLAKYYGSRAQYSSPTSPVIAASNCRMLEMKTAEKFYRINDRAFSREV